MVNSDKFTSVNELFERLFPALRTKIDELKREKILNIKEVDIWNYCVDNIWTKRNDLRIYEMVNDILLVDGLEVKKFLNNGD